MKIATKIVAEVVAEASRKMSDPNYSATLVGGFVQTQRDATQYISAHADELGGTEAVVNAIFHSSLLEICFRRGYGRSIRAMTFADLDHVADGDHEAGLREHQPAVLEYLAANVEQAPMRRVLTLIALAMDWVS